MLQLFLVPGLHVDGVQVLSDGLINNKEENQLRLAEKGTLAFVRVIGRLVDETLPLLVYPDAIGIVPGNAIN